DVRLHEDVLAEAALRADPCTVHHVGEMPDRGARADLRPRVDHRGLVRDVVSHDAPTETRGTAASTPVRARGGREAPTRRPRSASFGSGCTRGGARARPGGVPPRR